VDHLPFNRIIQSVPVCYFVKQRKKKIKIIIAKSSLSIASFDRSKSSIIRSIFRSRSSIYHHSISSFDYSILIVYHSTFMLLHSLLVNTNEIRADIFISICITEHLPCHRNLLGMISFVDKDQRESLRESTLSS
jgi:hypothetical protein